MANWRHKKGKAELIGGSGVIFARCRRGRDAAVETIRTQAVTFDVGGTLIQPWPSVGAVYAEVAERHGFSGLDADRIEKQFHQAMAEKTEFQHTEEEWFEVVRESFRGLLSEADCEAFFPFLYEKFGKAAVWRIYGDVLPALDQLAERGFRLAAVSNWDARLRPLLRELSLLPFFEAVSVSSEVGFLKPSTVLFEHALRMLGLPANAVVHIGDSFSEDVVGAKSAGLSAVLLQRTEKNSRGSISQLTELSTLLAEGW